MTIFRLRPHHLICNICFSGKGYSEEFIQNFSLIHNTLNSKSNEATIKIVEGCDDICAKCPKNQNQSCEDENIVTKLDNAYLQILELELDQTITAINLHRKIQDNLTLADAQYICRTCSWYDDICKNVLPQVIHKYRSLKRPSK